jgi:hypothetical protein
MYRMGRCPDGILPETTIILNEKEMSLQHLKRTAESGPFSNTTYLIITVRIIDINMYERNYPPDGKKRAIIRFRKIY